MLKKEEESDVIIGIDLGTTFSCVGVWKNNKIEIVPNSSGKRLTPSYVYFDNQKRLIGDPAKNKIAKNAEKTVYDVKRLIGRNYSDPHVQNDMKLWPFKVEKDENIDKPLISIELNGKPEKFYPQQISAMILSDLKNSAEEFLGKKIKNAIITVPAYFNEGQRKATKEAGEIAGLNVVRIINEPTAAALAYGFNNQFDDVKTILVFDLGGGTFDVSILKLEKSEFKVLSINGNTHLGGEDFDNRLVKYCADKFEEENNINIMNNQKALRLLKKYCEQVKIELSNNLEANIDIDRLAEGYDFELNIHRTDFEDCCKDLFDKCFPPITQALEDANLQKEDIDEIVLVGGSTRIPKIQEKLKEYFNGKELSKKINSDEAVAEGATIQAQLIKDGKINDTIKFIDINPISLEIEKMTIMIPKNTPIPF